MLYKIPLIIIILSLGGIIYIIVRKFYSLSLIDVETIASEKEKEIKNKIIISRLKRRTSEELVSFENKILPFIKKLKEYSINLYGKLKELEKKYQEKGRSRFGSSDLKEKLRVLHTIARDYLMKEDLINAESKYIEIISLDPKNLEAYKGLADIYLKQKDYLHSKEVLLHTLKITNKDEEVFFKLGNLFKEEGDLEQAKKNYLKMVCLNPKRSANYVHLYLLYKEMQDYKDALKAIQKAVELEPDNAQNLELLIEINIILKDREEAEAAYEQLKIIDPEDERLEEIKRKIEEIK